MTVELKVRADGALTPIYAVVSGIEQGKTLESLMTPTFVGFLSIAENGTKAALTT